MSEKISRTLRDWGQLVLIIAGVAAILLEMGGLRKEIQISNKAIEQIPEIILDIAVLKEQIRYCGSCKNISSQYSND